VAAATAEYELRLSAFRLRFFFFLSVLSFVIAGLDPAIHAKASLSQRFHRRSGASLQHGPPDQVRW
jgi:hypothetical protein